jgi:hypothetical protein
MPERTHLPIVILEERVTATSFACDLGACKGACCTMPGGRGAPVVQEEVEAIAALLHVIESTLPDTSREVIASGGFWEGSGEDLSLRCVDERDCVFAAYDGPVAVCAIESAWHRGEVAFRKPLSCHLFPIRRTHSGFDRLYVEYLPACDPGYRRGRAEGVPLVVFAKDALTRAYGGAWYKDVIEDRP